MTSLPANQPLTEQTLRVQEDIEATIRADAEMRGMDPEAAVKVFRREGAIGVVRMTVDHSVKTASRKAMPGGADARFMAEADGYVMARRPGRMPFVLTLRDWLALPDPEPKG